MSDTTAMINATNLGCSLTCKDLEASIRFYRDAIGFAVGLTFENEGRVVTAVVEAGDCRIVLNQDDGKLGWDRIKGQGFYLQINVAGAAEVFRLSTNSARRSRMTPRAVATRQRRCWGRGRPKKRATSRLNLTG